MLPDLIRRLILSTIDYKAIDHIAFPCGDDIGKPGYDGVLTTRESNPYIPIGKSVWEMSTQKGIDAKANSDYQKRISGDTNDNDTTFIFVTAYKWNNKDNWIAAKTTEGFWKEVRAYDAIDLESWLLLSLSTNLWFLELLGRFDINTETLENYVKHWMSSFKMKLPIEIALMGRNQSLEKLNSILMDRTQTQSIKSETKDESVVFLYAAILALPDVQYKYALLTGALVIKSAESLKHLDSKSNTGLLIVPVFKNIQDLVYHEGCQYIIPLDPSNPSDNNAILLSRIDIQSLSKQLKTVGFPENKADRLAKDSGGSLTILRRLLSRNYRPEWAQCDNDILRQVIPIMLTQSWVTSYKGDNDTIAKLTGKPYNEYDDQLTLLLNYPDRPIIKIGDLWSISSVLDSYLAFISFVSKKDWEVFKDVVIEVLRDKNPELELDPDKRYAAAMYGKKWQYSEDIRRGLAQSLILISIYGEYSNTVPGNDHHRYVEQIVSEIFHEADQAQWYSLGDVMPLLAEASPRKFLSAVEASLDSEEKAILGMFTETDDSFTSRSAHHHLLWTLEALAWDNNYFRRSVMALCELSVLDKSGKVVNRPLNSLRSIFRLWLPQTEASVDSRFEILSKIAQEYDEIGWNLLVSLLPKSHDTGSYTYRFKWRELSCSTDIRVTRSEHYNSTCRLVELLIPFLGLSVNRWIDLLDHYPELPTHSKEKLLEYFRSNLSNIQDIEFRFMKQLRNIVSRHRTFKTANWAMPEEHIKPLEAIYLLIQPNAAYIKNKYLFDDQFPDLIDGKEDYKKDREYLNMIRTKAVEELLSEVGFTGLIEFSNTIGFQHILADSVKNDVISGNLDSILGLLASDNVGELYFSQHLIRKGLIEFGTQWGQNLIQLSIRENWVEKKIVNLALSFPSEKWLRDMLNDLNPEIQQEYWSKAQVYHYNMTIEDIMYVIDKLNKVNRFYTSLEIAESYMNSLPIDLIVEILDLVATKKCIEQQNSMVTYYAEELLELIQSSALVDIKIKQKLEWFYLSIIASDNSRTTPRFLHEDMSSNPETFLEVLGMVYKPKQPEETTIEVISPEGEDRDAVGERIAENAWKLLDSWHQIPGGTEMGLLDFDLLKAWIERVVELSISKGFHAITLCIIGQVLSYSPSEEDGQWPCITICRILEEFKDETIHRNFLIGVHNQRGVTCRGVFEGGRQERVLAAKYRDHSHRIQDRYPRVSDLLLEIADSYESDAKREDDYAEKNLLRY
jgi:hypothetical protein